jgi:5S rRNA maturation endonuclease (ribonuclease M5)
MELVIQQLQTHGTNPKQRGDTYMARCPAHEDNTPSLSISPGTEPDSVLLHCFAGCSIDQITTAIGITPKQLFKARERTNTLGEQTDCYTYTNTDGEPVLRVHRFEPKTFRQSHWNGTSWQWGAGDTPKLLYRLPRITEAISTGETIYVVEGERDVHTLENLGLYATTNAGGAGKFTEQHAQQLVGASNIIIIADQDQPGIDHAQRVAAEINWLGITHSVMQPASGHKDVTDHIDAGLAIEQLQSVDTTGTTDTTPDTEDTEDTDHGWNLANLTEVLSDDYQPPTPTIGTRTDNKSLFYLGRINALFGESGSGKSWVAMATCAQQINTGNHVVYIDLEDHVGSVAHRMIKLGCTKTDVQTLFHYINPMAPFNTLASIDLLQLITTTNTQLVVIDSTGEAMALDGAEPNSDDSTARWFRNFPRLLAHAGPCVLLLDHMAKSNDTNQGFAIGSQRKRAAIDGAAYRVEVGVAPAKGLEGHLKLITAKDRGGYYQHGHKVAEVEINDSTTGINVTIKPPSTGLPTILMGRICDYLATNPTASSQNAIIKAVKGNDDAIRVGLQNLVDLGYIDRTANAGKGGGFKHTLIKAFNEIDLMQTTETPTASTASNRVLSTMDTPTDLTASTASMHSIMDADGRGWSHETDTAENPTASNKNGRSNEHLPDLF